MTSDTTARMSQEEIDHFKDLARQFAKKSLLPLFEGEFPDGNLSLLQEKINVAFDIGLAASPDPATEGHHYGIWGKSAEEYGPAPSLMLLSKIAETCGGVAMCLNAQGVSTSVLMKAGKKLPFIPKRTALCLMEGPYPPYLGALLSPATDSPARIKTAAVPEGDGYLLSGEKHFAYSLPGPDGLVVMAQTDTGWGAFLVPADADGVSAEDAGRRTGLRACSVLHVSFGNVRLPAGARLDGGRGGELALHALCCSWLGMAAIATGIARGAVNAAKEYAAERYQGGAMIEEHPAVKTLIAQSESKAKAAEAMLNIEAAAPSSLTGVRAAAMAKLTGIDLCAQAVTDCLQTLGGYGYMEDFGMEKRLRDVAVLKSAWGPPHYLRQLIFDIEKEAQI